MKSAEREKIHTFAQTNIQLLNQLQRAGYTAGELDLVRVAYELAIKLFTGRFRASGKTFIAHLVGTASVLGSLRASAALVAAGLLHAAYQAGDFGDGVPGIANAKRDRLKVAVGDEVEEYVARYDALPWGAKYITGYHQRAGALSGLERDVLLMRLANELEEYLDLGILYFGDKRRQQTDYLNDDGRMVIEMAESLGFPALGADLARAFEEVARADFAPALRGANARNTSFVLAPQSYQRIMDVLAKRLRGAEQAKAVSEIEGEVFK